MDQDTWTSKMPNQRVKIHYMIALIAVLISSILLNYGAIKFIDRLISKMKEMGRRTRATLRATHEMDVDENTGIPNGNNNENIGYKHPVLGNLDSVDSPHYQSTDPLHPTSILTENNANQIPAIRSAPVSTANNINRKASMPSKLPTIISEGRRSSAKSNGSQNSSSNSSDEEIEIIKPQLSNISARAMIKRRPNSLITRSHSDGVTASAMYDNIYGQSSQSRITANFFNPLWFVSFFMHLFAF